MYCNVILLYTVCIDRQMVFDKSLQTFETGSSCFTDVIPSVLFSVFILIIIMFGISHVLFSLGYKSITYKQFFEASQTLVSTKLLTFTFKWEIFQMPTALRTYSNIRSCLKPFAVGFYLKVSIDKCLAIF